MAPLIGLGVDPGFANTGIAGVALLEGRFVSLGLRVVETKPDNDRHLRRSSDDAIRTAVYFDAVSEAIMKLKPSAMGVEGYAVYDTASTAKLIESARDVVGSLAGFTTPEAFLQDPQAFVAHLKKVEVLKKHAWAGSETMGLRGRGKAAKTLRVVAAAECAARAAGVSTYVFTPGDRTKRFVGRGRASKNEVIEAIIRAVDQAAEHLEARVRRPLWEHAADAMAHAVLAVEEHLRWQGGHVSGVTS